MVNGLVQRCQLLSKVAGRFDRFGKGKTAFLTNFQTFLNSSRKKNRWSFKLFFSKLVHRKGCFGKKKFDFSSLIFDSRNILTASLKEQGLILLQDKIQGINDALTVTEAAEVANDEPEQTRQPSRSSRRRKRRFAEEYLYYD